MEGNILFDTISNALRMARRPRYETGRDDQAEDGGIVRSDRNRLGQILPDESDGKPSKRRRSVLKGIGTALGGMVTAGLASSPAAGQEYVEGRFVGNYYNQMLAVAYIGAGSVPYSTGARSGYDPYADPDTMPTPIEGWQSWVDPNQPTAWQIQAPHDWESYGDYFGSLQGVIPPGRDWPLWLYRSLDAGLVYDGPTPLPTDIDTGVAAETQLVVERTDYTQSLQQFIETEYQLLRQQDGIYSTQQYPEFFTYYTQTNGEPGAFWARWQLPPERYWFSGNGTDMQIIGPGWNERQTLVVENWVVRGSTLFVVHADIKMHHDPSQIEPGIMRGWRSVTEDVLYQMVTSFVTYTYL